MVILEKDLLKEKDLLNSLPESHHHNNKQKLLSYKVAKSQQYFQL